MSKKWILKLKPGFCEPKDRLGQIKSRLNVRAQCDKQSSADTPFWIRVRVRSLFPRRSRTRPRDTTLVRVRRSLVTRKRNMDRTDLCTDTRINVDSPLIEVSKMIRWIDLWTLLTVRRWLNTMILLLLMTH